MKLVRYSSIFNGSCILWILIGFSACVETLPIIPESNTSQKIFIECELQSGAYTEAFVSLAEYINSGSNQTSIPSPEAVSLLIGEMHKEWRVPFSYNDNFESYMVFDQALPVQPGKFYAFSGKLKEASENLRGIIEVPAKFSYDSIQWLESSIQQIGAKKWRSSGRLRIYYDRLNLESDHYLHLLISDTLSQSIPTQPLSNPDYYFKLEHRPGFLWKIDRNLNTNFFEVSFVAERSFLLQDIVLSIKNTTLSYYDYQKFKSNSPQIPNHSQNPAIAAFNMKGEAGYGSLMATTEEILRLHAN